jgi:hypothetical protein
MKSDPFNFLGYGMVAYRDLMFTFTLLFVALTIVMIPVMSIYKGHNAIQ